jgi:hypothetical protein
MGVRRARLTVPLYFLTGARLTSEQLTACLSDVARRLVSGEGLGLRVGPEVRLSTSAWTLWPVEVDEGARRALTAGVGEATCALAEIARHEVVGLSMDEPNDVARICRCRPGSEPESVTGGRERVAATLSRWLELDPGRVAAVLGVADSPESREEPDPATLEEERFIERKLAEARAWMERYRGGKREG